MSTLPRFLEHRLDGGRADRLRLRRAPASRRNGTFSSSPSSRSRSPSRSAWRSRKWRRSRRCRKAPPALRASVARHDRPRRLRVRRGDGRSRREELERALSPRRDPRVARLGRPRLCGVLAASWPAAASSAIGRRCASALCASARHLLHDRGRRHGLVVLGNNLATVIAGFGALGFGLSLVYPLRRFRRGGARRPPRGTECRRAVARRLRGLHVRPAADRLCRRLMGLRAGLAAIVPIVALGVLLAGELER